MFPTKSNFSIDNEKNVVEVMLGFLLAFFQSQSSTSISVIFYQFIADNIYKQLVNFLSLRHFIYYNYLLKIFQETNKRHFLKQNSYQLNVRGSNFSSSSTKSCLGFTTLFLTLAYQESWMT
jgi:hypothetical protein